MEDQCSPFNWDFFHEEEGMEEYLWHSLLHKTLELDTRVSSAKEEIIKKEDELLHLKDFLSRALRERDEAESKCQTIMLDIITLQQQLQHQKQQKQDSILSHDVTEQPKEAQLVDQVDQVHTEPQHIVDTMAHFQPQLTTPSAELPPAAEKLAAGKPLPEKGKLLQAVMEAGPLLQTLLLAGPLPQWQHPPPRVDSVEIPPVAISRPPVAESGFRGDYFSCLGRKRSLPHSEGSAFPSNTKCQKVALY